MDRVLGSFANMARVAMGMTAFPLPSDSRVLLTGGTGFFGRALLRYWERAYRADVAIPALWVLTRNPARFLHRWPMFSALPWLRFVEGNMLRPHTLPVAESFSHVIHAAADSTDVQGLTGTERFAQILDGTRNLLDFAAAHGASRFLLTSSGGVYGALPPHLDAFPEDWHGIPDPLDPASAYGISKRAAEHLCALYSAESGLEVVIARGFAFVGPDLPLDAHFAIGNFIRDALGGGPVRVQGDGSPVRSYLHQSDLAEWLLTLLARGQSGRAYNVGSDECVTIKELASLVRDLLAPDAEVEVLRQGGIPGPRNRYVPDIRRAREELGLAVRIPLADAILRTGMAHRAIVAASDSSFSD